MTPISFFEEIPSFFIHGPVSPSPSPMHTYIHRPPFIYFKVYHRSFYFFIFRVHNSRRVIYRSTRPVINQVPVIGWDLWIRAEIGKDCFKYYLCRYCLYLWTFIIVCFILVCTSHEGIIMLSVEAYVKAQAVCPCTNIAL